MKNILALLLLLCVLVSCAGAQLQVGDFSVGQKTQAGKPLTERRIPGGALRLWGTQSDGTPQSYQLGNGLSFSGGYLTATGGGGGGSLPSYTGQAGKVLRVAVGETDVEWVSSLSTIADGSITGSKLATAYAPLASPTFTGTVTIPSGATISGYLAVNGSAAALTDFPTLNQSTTGNAATATILQTARNINGVAFNGSADITVPAAAGTLTGSTLASGVVTSSLQTVGTVTAGVWNATALADAYIASASAWNAKVAATRSISASGLASGGGDLSADRTITVTGATQVEALAGLSNAVVMTPLRTREALQDYAQPVDADLTAVAALTTTAFGRSLLTPADDAAARTLLGLGTLATQNGTLSDYLTTATAASTYEPILTAGTTSQYYRGDKSWQTLNASAVGLGNVSNALQLVAANNLSDLANAATARTNLGLGTLATQNANEVEITGGDVTGVNSVAIVGASGLSIGNNIGTAGLISLYDGAGFLATIQTAVLSDFQALTLPDATGTFITTGNLSSITATGTITSGTWNGSTIAIANGGTGATTASAARIALLPSMTGNGGKFLRVNAGATDYELATISGGGDALTSGTLDQFADVTQTATKTLAITDSTTLAGGTHSGTNTGDVTLAGTPDYITISGQTITRGSVDLTTDVTGTLPIANGGTGQTSQTTAFDALAPTTTKGDLIVHNGSDNIRVSVGGTNGHVLTVDSAEASGVKWAASSGGGGYGGWTLISTTTISGSPAQIDFTFSGSYRRYKLEFENVYCSADGYMLRMRTSADGGSTFDSGAANYGYAYGASGTYGPVSTTGTYIETSTNFVGSGTDEGLWGEIEFYDPKNTGLKTFAVWRIFGRVYNSAAANVITGAGYRDSAAAADAVRLFFSTGNFGGGKIRLFGWTD